MATEKKETKKAAPKKTSPKKEVSKSTPKKKAVAKTAPKKTKSVTKKENTTFAVIETGGKQYRVEEGDIISIEKLADTKEGDKFTFENVLLIDDGKKTDIGNPTLKGKKVTAEIKEEGKGKKLHVIRFKSKSRYYKKTGHRQPYMKAEIIKIG